MQIIPQYITEYTIDIKKLKTQKRLFLITFSLLFIDASQTISVLGIFEFSNLLFLVLRGI